MILFIFVRKDAQNLDKRYLQLSNQLRYYVNTSMAVDKY